MIVLISNVNAFRQSTSETMKPEKIQRREVLEAGAEEGTKGMECKQKIGGGLSTNILPPIPPQQNGCSWMEEIHLLPRFTAERAGVPPRPSHTPSC